MSGSLGTRALSVISASYTGLFHSSTDLTEGWQRSNPHALSEQILHSRCMKWIASRLLWTADKW